MSKGTSTASSFKAGMYLLDSFTSGMYNDPLIVYREYIQNAVDSIDSTQSKGATPLSVSIELEPGPRTITIRDNAMGIPALCAEEVLCSIGSSKKADNCLRGFRGIGRLGGIAFSDHAVFRTKAKGEALESIHEWDCRALCKLLAEGKKEDLTLEEVFLRVTRFRQQRCKGTRDSYFEVTLSGVSSFRNQLFDMEKVRRYLRQVAPVPFSYEEFSYAQEIDQYLESRLSSYGRYNIFLNGEPIYKPYKDAVKITKGDADQIEGIEFFEITNGKDKPWAVGWYGRRRELLGSIVRGDDSSGVRVRVGNIQIGDAHLLDFCYREPRFNSYVTGEVHADCRDLIPNSRRDDFVDNPRKGQFYNLLEKEVGLPISKEIRSRSRLASIKPMVSPSQATTVPENGKHPLPSTGSTCDVFVSVQVGKAKEEIIGVVLKPTDLGSSRSCSVSEIALGICDQCPKLNELLAALQNGKMR